ncbi:hypothetical protein OSJ04_25445, partial [Mycobacterium ulcerans]
IINPAHKPANQQRRSPGALGAVVAATIAAAALSSCSSSGDPGIQDPTIQGAASSADLINAG